jgi:hypothetical protein
MAEETAATAVAAETQAAGPKIKIKKPRQRACDEKDAKGKVCCGHLKRWYEYPPEVEALIGKKAEVYRCENCQVLYRPDFGEMPRSFTHRF